MPLVRLSASEEYFLVNFDEEGRERREEDGTFLTERLLALSGDAACGYTDVVFMSHGWKGDLPAARAQYDAWTAAMAGESRGRDEVRRRLPAFKPLVVGLHWPSLPWGEESPSSAPAVLSGGDAISDFRTLAVTPAASRAIEMVLDSARSARSQNLPANVRRAYSRLIEEVGSAMTWPEPLVFDPQAVVDAAGDVAPGGGERAIVLGRGFNDLLLTPLRQLSFWTMKDRARRFGESGAHTTLSSLAGSGRRTHLMGHSFGCIVASTAVAGPNPEATLGVDTLFLVQGALSTWAFSPDIPLSPGTAGYLHRLLDGAGVVRGPVIATTSRFDRAVHDLYPAGARVARQLTLGGKAQPRYGGIGAFGILGVERVQDIALRPADEANGFRPGGVYNVDASGVVRNGGGLSGAHSDIAHPEVANAFWEAILCTVPDKAGEPALEGAPTRTWKGAGLLGMERSDSAKAAAGMASRGFPMRRPKLPTDGASDPGASGSEAGSSEDVPTGDLADSGRGSAADAPVARQRWVNTAIERDVASEPLAVGRWYTFSVDVGTIATASDSVPFEGEAVFHARTGLLDVTVQLASADFEIARDVGTLTLGAEGAAEAPARFGISPKRRGTCAIQVTLHREGNFIQRLEAVYEIGLDAPPKVTRVGRPIAAAETIQSRDVGISLSPTGSGYECIVWGPVSARASLPLSRAHLAEAVETCRSALLQVVGRRDGNGQRVFQTSMNIPAGERDAALRVMAEAGARLFQKLFFGAAAAKDAQEVGNFLISQLGHGGPAKKLQVLTRDVPLPWSCLYLGEVGEGASLDWDRFIGMSHVVEQIPLQPDLLVQEVFLPSDRPALSVSVNVNAGIDDEMKLRVVAEQDGYWERVGEARRVKVRRRTRVDEILHALSDPNTGDQVIYLYCHATSVGLDAPGGPDKSCLILADGELSLERLSLNAPRSRAMVGEPLVFINACESAAMSPAFYDGFVPYFMARGARGVVGTECDTPAVFAKDFAGRFFDRFLDGETVGSILLSLRQEYLRNQGNPLGLLYAAHCDGDTRILPAPA